jgi:hypothetical protein
MKQILPQLKEVSKHLSFMKSSFTSRGFRHVVHYIDGLIALNKKTIKQISIAIVEGETESSLNRVLSEAIFKQDVLEERYLKKIAYLMGGMEVSLLFDDTLVKREGKKVEETQRHKNHSGSEEFITGHQFFTSVLYTPVLQLPLLPKLYSKNTGSKIQMALDIIDFVLERMPIGTVLFDSWYSDKKIIKKCMTRKVRVVCVIKTNRTISLERGEWLPLSTFSKDIPRKEFEYYLIDENEYKVANHLVKLKGVPVVKMITSKKKEGKRHKKKAHIISTNKKDTPAEIIRFYENRWFIETYHRDIKQNLGFDKVFVRKKEGIVRHSIFSSLAYTTLKLYMFHRGMNMTIGECITHIQGKEMDDFIQEIIEVEDRQQRIELFKEVFKRETGEV